MYDLGASSRHITGSIFKYVSVKFILTPYRLHIRSFQNTTVVKCLGGTSGIRSEMTPG